MISLTVLPDGVKVNEMKGHTPDGAEVVSRMLTLVDGRSGISINVGPFTEEEWDQWLAYLANPEEETAKQQIREKLVVAHGGALPKMEIPRG